MLPIDHVQPTPFQRDLSEAHHKRLAGMIEKTGRFLDPVIVVPAPEEGFWTPNGFHRLEAMRRLGARSITALVVPDRDIARQILALNTEKAHNLKEKALEVIRIYKGLLPEEGSQPESSFAFYLEDASLVTLGLAYENKRGFAGGAYHPVLRRVEEFSEQPINKAIQNARASRGAAAGAGREGGRGDCQAQGTRAAKPLLAIVRRGADQSTALDQGRTAGGRESSADDARCRAARFNTEKVKQQGSLRGFRGALRTKSDQPVFPASTRSMVRYIGPAPRIPTIHQVKRPARLMSL